MIINTMFTHADGRQRLLKVSGSNLYTISMIYESGEVSKMAGLPIDEAQKWYRNQGQLLMTMGFYFDDASPVEESKSPG